VKRAVCVVAAMLAYGIVQAADSADTADGTGELEPAVTFDPGSGNASRSATGEDAPETESGVDVSEAPPVRTVRNDRAMDSLDLDSTVITGNQELPKVLYIVPWKKAELGQLPGRPVNSLVNEILEPVDRDEFRRRIAYYDTLFGTQITDSSGSDQ
jgi:hypothetical protein